MHIALFYRWGISPLRSLVIFSRKELVVGASQPVPRHFPGKFLGFFHQITLKRVGLLKSNQGQTMDFVKTKQFQKVPRATFLGL